MILGECGVFAAMFGAGILAGCIARVLGVLGGAGDAARNVSDTLIAAESAAIYFLALYYASCGVFRLYALLSFLGGYAIILYLLGMLSPSLRRLIKSLASPLMKWCGKVDAALEKRLRPLREKTTEKRKARKKKRAARRAEKREKKAAGSIGKGKKNVSRRLKTKETFPA